MKTLIVGGVAAGASAAERTRKRPLLPKASRGEPPLHVAPGLVYDHTLTLKKRRRSSTIRAAFPLPARSGTGSAPSCGPPIAADHRGKTESIAAHSASGKNGTRKENDQSDERRVAKNGKDRSSRFSRQPPRHSNQ